MSAPVPRIGLHSGWDLTDPAAWSGVVAPLARRITEVHPGVVHLPALTVRDAPIDRARARLGRQSVLPRHATATARRRSRALRRELRAAPLDLLVTIAASTDLVLPPPVPVLQITDATFPAITGFYPLFSDLSARSRAQGRRVERLAAAHSTHFLVTSDWARASLISDVGVPGEHITIAPFGPAIPPTPGAEGAPPRSRAAPPVDGALELLFVTSDWERKNGADALRIHAAVQEHRPSRLTIVGEVPPGTSGPGIRALGRVDAARLSTLYRKADVLLEPSLANASGVVITDALAHGLPVLAVAAGGVPTLVRPGVNGWLLPPARLVHGATEVLRRVRREELHDLALTAAEDSRARLSWRAWGEAFERATTAAAAALGPAAAASVRRPQSR